MRTQQLIRHQHCVYNINYHLVIVTKYRRKCLTAAMLAVIHELASRRAEAWDGAILELNGEADHVHILFSLPPHRAVAEFVNMLKTNTSRILRRDFRLELAPIYDEPVLWSRSYCVLSAGGAPLEVLRAYIEQQAKPD